MFMKREGSAVQPGSKDHALFSIVRSWMSPPRSADSANSNAPASRHAHLGLVKRADSRKPVRPDNQHHFERALSTGHHNVDDPHLYAHDPKEPGEYMEEFRSATRAFYDHTATQVFVALLILGGFGIQIWEFETFPSDGTVEKEIMVQTDFYLTLVFAGELAINLFSHWFKPFLQDPFNIYDVAVVAVSVVSLFLDSIPGVAALRILRVFRLFRLFGKKKGLRRIVTSICAALVPVFYAFAIAAIVMAVFAVLGVSLFKEKAPEYFGSFTNSLHSMFIICTVDGWVEIVNVTAPGKLDPGKLFFIFYVVILVWTLLPVIIAVLLNKFGEQMRREKNEETREQAEAFRPMTPSPLDPFLKPLLDFESEEDLSQKIRVLYVSLDTEGRGSLKHFSIAKALKQMGIPEEEFSEKDFDRITDEQRLCDEDGGIDVDTFEEIAKMELRGFLQRQLSGDLGKCELPGDGAISATLASFKLLLLNAGEDPAGQLKFNSLRDLKRAVTGDAGKRSEREKLRGREWGTLQPPQRGRSLSRRGSRASVGRSGSRGRSHSRGASRGRGRTAGEGVNAHRGERSQSPEGMGGMEEKLQKVIEGQNRMGEGVWELASGEGELYKSLMAAKRQRTDAVRCAVCQERPPARQRGRLQVCERCAEMLAGQDTAPAPASHSHSMTMAPPQRLYQHAEPQPPASIAVQTLPMDVQQASLDMAQQMIGSRAPSAAQSRDLPLSATAPPPQAVAAAALAGSRGGSQRSRAAAGPSLTQLDIEQASLDMAQQMIGSRMQTAAEHSDVQQAAMAFAQQAAAMGTAGGAASIPIQDAGLTMAMADMQPAQPPAAAFEPGPVPPSARSARSFATVHEPTPLHSAMGAREPQVHSLPSRLGRSSSMGLLPEQGPRPSAALQHSQSARSLSRVAMAAQSQLSQQPQPQPSPLNAWGSQRRLAEVLGHSPPMTGAGQSPPSSGPRGPTPMAAMASRNLVSAQQLQAPAAAFGATTSPAAFNQQGVVGGTPQQQPAGMGFGGGLAAVAEHGQLSASQRAFHPPPADYGTPSRAAPRRSQQQQLGGFWPEDMPGRLDAGFAEGVGAYPPGSMPGGQAQAGMGPGADELQGVGPDRLDTGSQSQFLFFTGAQH